MHMWGHSFMSDHHRILEKDPDRMVGVCSICGPVKLTRKNGRRKGSRLMCGVKQASYYGKPGRGYRHGTCAICRRDARLVWDHDHATGAFRGWLCDHCNTGLGHFKEDSVLLRMAAYYLDSGVAPVVRLEADAFEDAWTGPPCCEGGCD
jgi:Recombination endonuclease VII